MKLTRFFNDLSDIIWPSVCMGCGQRFDNPNESLVCSSCMMEMPKVDYYKHDENIVTEEFFRESIALEYGCCFFQFTKGDWTQNLMHNFKYFKHPELGVKFGRMAAAELKRHGRFTEAEYIVPVPMHPDKIKVRGYNQAERIAYGMSEVMQLPIREDILEKTVNSQTQTFMRRDERIRNADKIFRAKRVGEIAHSHFLIVDDVFTTGSTLLVCAKKIHEVMPECKISVFALARA
ncbi:MAG: ComF family protein [Bacteroidales bacterium]|nr:ComF family protein [Bacteroidales bacterium]